MPHKPSPTTRTTSLWPVMLEETVCTARSRRPSTRAKPHPPVPASSPRVSSHSMTSPSFQLLERRGKTFPFIQTMRKRASTATCSRVQPDNSSKSCHLSRIVHQLDIRRALASLISSSARGLSSLVGLSSATSPVVDSVISVEGQRLNNRTRAR